ncbi:MAG: AI-2E family transporter [Saprospirales bacterium]|nr:AI-2E family transporter [Saprospirales bacterium]
MNKQPVSFPFYAKASLLIIGFYFFIRMLSIAQDIILPLIYAGIIAILMGPAVNFLIKKKINRVISIAGVLAVASIVAAALVALFFLGASKFSEALPQLVDKFQVLLNQAIARISGVSNISTHLINEWIKNTKETIINNSGAAIGTTFATLSGVLTTIFLTPVYIFMLLFYQPHLVEFMHRLFGAKNNSKITEILSETKSVIQQYIVGLFAEFAIVAVLNSASLLILGIEYAILFGILGAFLNVIPYLGGAITMVLFSVITLMTKSPVYTLYVLGMYTFIQLIDNNYIVPKVVGSKVQLNAFISLITVIVGAALWGIPGMFLSIPLTAIVKLLLDRIEPLKSWGFLLGDTMPPLVELKLDFKEIAKKLPRIKRPTPNK